MTQMLPRYSRLVSHSLTPPPHPPLPPLKGGGEVNFDYLPRRRGVWKIKKGGGSMVQGQVLLKGQGGGEADIFPILFF